MHDAAVEMVRRGYRVLVFTSARGYDDPAQRYGRREILDEIEIRRFPLSSFGKRSIKVRLFAQALFLLQVLVHGVLVRRLSVVLVSTSPPMASASAVLIAALRGVPLKYWVMDLNPDQMISLGILSERSLAVRVFDWLNHKTLVHATDVIALDRFMEQRLKLKGECARKIVVIPPWPHVDYAEPVAHERNPFRSEHQLGEEDDAKFVIMYSGNHGPSNPIDTVLAAAERLTDRKEIVFMFVGGGLQKERVEAAIAAGHDNIRSLPYQPMDTLRYSLSAADVHIVTVGDEIVGICHPCKIYGAMAVARPIFLIGPESCHVSEIMNENEIGWHVRHGDVDGAVDAIVAMSSSGRAKLRKMGATSRRIVQAQFAKDSLVQQLCDVLERGVAPAGSMSGRVMAGAP